jgi:hypothetical protein
MKIRICQVCGKEYDSCKTPVIAEGFFQWRDIACSPQCAIKYMAQKENESKQETPATKPAKTTQKAKKSVKKTTKEVVSQP